MKQAERMVRRLMSEAVMPDINAVPDSLGPIRTAKYALDKARVELSDAKDALGNGQGAEVMRAMWSVCNAMADILGRISNSATRQEMRDDPAIGTSSRALLAAAKHLVDQVR